MDVRQAAARAWRGSTRRFALAVLALVAPPAADARQPDAKPLATPAWYGELEAGDRQFRFVIESAEEDGKRVARLRSLDEGDRRFDLGGFDDAGGRLVFDLAASAAAYAGAIDAAGVATGTWKQRGNELPLVFRRVAEGAKVPPDPDEVWAGTLDAVVQKLPLRFRISKGADGARSVHMDSLAQRAGGFRGDLAIEGAEWKIDVPAVKGSFRGTLGADGKLSGLWRQGGAALALLLEPVDVGALADGPAPRKRPQLPQPPFPYESREARIVHEAAGAVLAGTLTLPRGPGPHPAVVLVSGSGPQDRDETIADHKPFLVIADALSRAGVAVLRYDDRGVGGSSGDVAAATTADFAADAGAAVDWLRGQPGIDPARIAVVGHSEGGIIAAMLGATRRDLAAIVLLAGTAVDGRRILLSQGELVPRAEGVTDEAALRRGRVMQEAILDAVAGSDAAADPAALAAAAGARIMPISPTRWPRRARRSRRSSTPRWPTASVGSAARGSGSSWPTIRPPIWPRSPARSWRLSARRTCRSHRRSICRRSARRSRATATPRRRRSPGSITSSRPAPPAA
ncbi:MAG: alpha/beta hydrolase family protein [Planctomycetaceae bacterium]